MPATLYEKYAAKLCRALELKPSAYEAERLNVTVMTLPLAETHAAKARTELENLPRLGDTITLDAHMKVNFFERIEFAARDFIGFTSPFLIQRRHLERLEGWRDWRGLKMYLNGEGLDPVMVFRNTPVPLAISQFEKADFYVADIRVRFMREAAFQWHG